MAAIIIPPTKNIKQDMQITGVANNALQSVSVTAQKVFDTENDSMNISHYLPTKKAFNETYKETTSSEIQQIRNGNFGNDAGLSFGISFNNLFAPSWKYQSSPRFVKFDKTTTADGGTIENASYLASFDSSEVEEVTLPLWWRTSYYDPDGNNDIETVNYTWQGKLHCEYIEARISKTNFGAVFNNIGVNANPNILPKLILGGMKMYLYSTNTGDYSANNITNIREYKGKNIVFSSNFKDIENTTEGVIQSAAADRDYYRNKVKFFNDDAIFTDAVNSIKKTVAGTVYTFGPLTVEQLPVSQNPSAVADSNYPYWLMKGIFNSGATTCILIDTQTEPKNIIVKAFMPKAAYITYDGYVDPDYANAVSVEKGVCLEYLYFKIFNVPSEMKRTFTYENNYVGRTGGAKKRYSFGTVFNQATSFIVNGDNDSLEITDFAGKNVAEGLLSEYKYGKRKYSCTIPIGSYKTTSGTTVDNYIPTVGDRHIPLRLQDNKPLAYNKDLSPCQFEIYLVRIDTDKNGGFNGFYVEGIEVTKVI